MGTVQNVFCYLARTHEPPQDELPDLSGLGYCAVATNTFTPVNVRNTPEIADNIITQLNPLSIYKVSHYTLAGNGEKWYRVEYQQNVYAWCSAAVTRTNCDDLPLWNEQPPNYLLELIVAIIKWIVGLFKNGR